jgi:hypothetical protein
MQCEGAPESVAASYLTGHQSASDSRVTNLTLKTLPCDFVESSSGAQTGWKRLGSISVRRDLLVRNAGSASGSWHRGSSPRTCSL